MQHYELNYIVPVKYLDDELQKITADVNGMIKSFAGEITLESTLGKQRLAYQINNVHQGTYIIVEFNMEGESMKKLDDLLKLKTEVLRHLIIKKKIKTASEIKKQEQVQESIRREKEVELAQIEEKEKGSVKGEDSKPKEKITTTKSKSPKTTLEDLDKKLDEILSDDIL